MVTIWPMYGIMGWGTEGICELWIQFRWDIVSLIVSVIRLLPLLTSLNLTQAAEHEKRGLADVKYKYLYQFLFLLRSNAPVICIHAPLPPPPTYGGSHGIAGLGAGQLPFDCLPSAGEVLGHLPR